MPMLIYDVDVQAIRFELFEVQSELSKLVNAFVAYSQLLYA